MAAIPLHAEIGRRIPLRHRLEPYEVSGSVHDHWTVLQRPLLRSQKHIAGCLPRRPPDDLDGGWCQICTRVEREDVAGEPGNRRKRLVGNPTRRVSDKKMPWLDLNPLGIRHRPYGHLLA